MIFKAFLDDEVCFQSPSQPHWPCEINSDEVSFKFVYTMSVSASKEWVSQSLSISDGREKEKEKEREQEDTAKFGPNSCCNHSVIE